MKLRAVPSQEPELIIWENFSEPKWKKFLAKLIFYLWSLLFLILCFWSILNMMTLGVITEVQAPSSIDCNKPDVEYTVLRATIDFYRP